MRYIPHTKQDVEEMLKSIGSDSVKDLFSSVPDDLRLKQLLKLPSGLSEPELLRHIETIGSKNKCLTEYTSFLGGGCYQHYIPSAVDQIASRSEWLTPYTPYQPEISQGTLQAIFEYQTMISMLTGMDVSNASHYDGATSTAEAALLSMNKTRRKKILVSKTLHPEYRDVIKTFISSKNGELVTIGYDKNGQIDRNDLDQKIKDDVASVIIQSPNFFGILEDLDGIADQIHEFGALFIYAFTEPISLAVIKSPAEWGADIACGEGQSFGCGLNYGGPLLGIFATKQKHLRMLPGRVVGQTYDKKGRRGFVLTLSTREQHIRRDKAFSNICSNEGILALRAAIYLALMGNKGLRDVASLNLNNKDYLKERLSKIDGAEIIFDSPTFNEFVVKLNSDSDKFSRRMMDHKIFAGIPLDCWHPEFGNSILICSTESHTKEDLDKYISAFQESL